MQGTMRPSTTPRIDPNEHARRIQEAKARAAELKARRQTDYAPAPAFQARPVPPSTYSTSNPPPSNDGGTYQHYSSVHAPQSQHASGAQRLPAVDVGPYGQQSYAQPASENRPAYRGMINYNNPPAAASNDGYARQNAYENKAQDHGYGHAGGSYASNGPVAPQPLAQNTYARNNAALAKEADDMFYSNLRSGSSAKGGIGKRPEWTSDFVSDPYASGPAQQSGASDNNQGAPKVLSTKMKLAMMRDDLTGQTSAADPRVSKEYAGIVPPQAGRGSSSAPQAPLGGAGGGYDAAHGSFGGASGSGFGGGGSSYSGRSSMGGAPAASGADSFADAFPARAGQVVSRTGLKPSGKKVQPANAGGTGGSGGLGAPSGSYSTPAPSSYGNDDIPVGGRAGGGAGGGMGGDPGMGAGAQRGYGNDDMPVGGAAMQAMSYGNDDVPIGGAAAKRASAGGYGMGPGEDFGPDSLPPGATPSTGGGPQRSAAAMRARAHAEKAKAAAAAESEDYTSPAIPSMSAQSRTRDEGPGGKGGGWSMDFGLDEKPRGSPPKLSSGGGGGRLDLLKSKMRSSSAHSNRSAGGADGAAGGQRPGGWAGGSGEDSGYDEEPGTSWSSRDPPSRPAGPGGPGGRPPSGPPRGGAGPMQSHSSSYESEGYDERPPVSRASPAKGPAPGRGGHSAPPAPAMTEEPEEGSGGPMHLLECSTCGRKFNEKALEKHERICAKVFLEKRKAFDMKAHIVPEEAQAMAASKAREERKGAKGAKGKAAAAAQASSEADAAAKKTAWEAKSNQLREAMRAAREYKAAVASGIDPRDIPPPVMSSAPDPSLVPCPHCGRTFNEHAAERHIPKCQSTKARPTMLKRGAGVAAGAAGVKKMGAPMTGGDLSMSSAGSGHGGYQSYDDWPAGGGGGMPVAPSAARASTAGGTGQRASIGGRASAVAAAPKRGGGLGYGDLPDLPDAPASALYGGGGGGVSGYGSRAGGAVGGRAGGLANSRVGGHGGGVDTWDDAPVGGGRASLARTSVGGAAGGMGRASMGGGGTSASGYGGGMAGAPMGGMVGRPPRGVGGSMSAGPTRQSMGGYAR